jgi:hypothetical protein
VYVPPLANTLQELAGRIRTAVTAATLTILNNISATLTILNNIWAQTD